MLWLALAVFFLLLSICYRHDRNLEAVAQAAWEERQRQKEALQAQRERQDAARHEAFMAAMVDGDRSAMRAIDPQAFQALREGNNLVADALHADLARRLALRA